MSSITLSIFVTSIFVIIFMSHNNINVTSARTNPSSLIEKVCPSSQHDLCIQLLESQPKIAAAKDFEKLAIAIMEIGISNGTNTLSYIENLLKKPVVGPNVKEALKVCDSSYHYATNCFKSALGEVVEDKDYGTATYDLALAYNDAINPCLDSMGPGKIEDETISIGNNVVILFALSAFKALEFLH